MFFIAVLMAVGAAWVANNWLQMRLTPTAEAATTPVIVAALKIAYGQKIEPIHIKTINLPDGTFPEGTFSDTSQVIGKIADQDIFPGEFLINERIVEQLGGSTLSALVTPQMRAVTVRVNDVVGVAGFLLPGNRVDVLATRNNHNSGASTHTILQDLKVLAVDQTASPDKEQPVIVRAVTLEMSPQQAEVMVKATNEGPIQLTLRNPGDSSMVARNDEVKPSVPVLSKPAPVRSSYSVTIIRGTQENKVNL